MASTIDIVRSDTEESQSDEADSFLPASSPVH